MSIVFPLFLVLLFTAMPAAFAIGIAALAYFIFSSPVPIQVAVQKLAAATQSFPLLAIPFFILAGNLMNQTGITPRLLQFATVLTGWMSGGLAQISIMLSTLMGGVSGSAVADASMQSRILGQHMLKQGYDRGFTAANIAFSAIITATLPPSLGLIVYGFVGGVSIGKLLLAGIVPGFLLMAIYMVTTWIVSRRNGYKPARETRPTLTEVISALRSSFWALMFPILLLFGIRFGVFTPTEAGAFCVAYALVVGIFIHRELDLRRFSEALTNSVTDIGAVSLIIMTSAILGHVFVLDRLPQTITSGILGITSDPNMVLLVIIIFMILIGMLMEATIMILLLTPILLPVATSVGIDPIHFGLIFVMLVSLGGNTPPVGVCMFTVCGLLKVPTKEYFLGSIPYIIGFLVMIMFLVLFPELVLYIPNQVYGI